MLVHTDQLIPPLEIGFERFEKNEFDNATILEDDTMSVWISVEDLACNIAERIYKPNRRE